MNNKSGSKIEFIIKKEHEYRDEEFNRKQRRSVLGSEAWVVAKEDLILSKLIWIQQIESEIQLNDLKALLRDENLDKKYLSEWSSRLKLKTFGLF